MLFPYMMSSPYGLLCAPTAQQGREPEGAEEKRDEQNPLDMIRDPFIATTTVIWQGSSCRGR